MVKNCEACYIKFSDCHVTSQKVHVNEKTYHSKKNCLLGAQTSTYFLGSNTILKLLSTFSRGLRYSKMNRGCTSRDTCLREGILVGSVALNCFNFKCSTQLFITDPKKKNLRFFGQALSVGGSVNLISENS